MRVFLWNILNPKLSRMSRSKPSPNIVQGDLSSPNTVIEIKCVHLKVPFQGKKVHFHIFKYSFLININNMRVV